MSYVGSGFGAYVQEVTYRYVGAGGSFDVVQARRTNFCIIGSVAAAVLVIVVLLLVQLWPGGDCSDLDSMGDIAVKICCTQGKVPADLVGTYCDQSIINPNDPCLDADPADLDPDELQLCCDAGTISEGCPAPEGPRSECIIWGDPHIQTFDKGHADFYSEGEVWLVKSKSIWMQARYKATPFTDGLAATETLAVGGDFLGMNTLKVGPMNSQITWNDRPILTTKPSTFDAEGFGTVSFNSEGALVDSDMSQEMAKWKLEKNIVHIELPRQVHIQIMRWTHHINVKIVMPAATGGQDGHCGNFNSNSGDDTTAAIILRMGRGVSSDESLFNNYVPYKETKKVSVDDCAPDVRAKAEKECKSGDMVGPELDSCIIDYCVAGGRYVVEDSME